MLIATGKATELPTKQYVVLTKSGDAAYVVVVSFLKQSMNAMGLLKLLQGKVKLGSSEFVLCFR